MPSRLLAIWSSAMWSSDHPDFWPSDHRSIWSSGLLFIWSSRLLAIWSSGHPTIRSSNHPVIQPFSHPTIRLSNPDFWPSDYPVICSSDHPVIRPSGHPTIQSSDHRVIRPSGLLVIWSSGLPYCMLHQSQISNVLPEWFKELVLCLYHCTFVKKLAYCALLCNNPAMFAKVQLDSVPRPSISLDTTRCVEEKLPAIANNFDIQTESKRNENVALPS